MPELGQVWLPMELPQLVMQVCLAPGAQAPPVDPVPPEQAHRPQVRVDPQLMVPEVPSEHVQALTWLTTAHVAPGAAQEHNPKPPVLSQVWIPWLPSGHGQGLVVPSVHVAGARASSPQADRAMEMVSRPMRSRSRIMIMASGAPSTTGADRRVAR